VGGGWHGHHARAWGSAAASWTTRRGVHSCAHLEAAHSDDLLPQPDLEGEGTRSPAEDGVGAIVCREGGEGGRQVLILASHSKTLLLN
jgi:hypothetical protein